MPEESYSCPMHNASSRGILTTGKGTYCTSVASLKYPANAMYTSQPQELEHEAQPHKRCQMWNTCLQGSAAGPPECTPDAEVQRAWSLGMDAESNV